jgi:hypothetical protein
MLETREVPAGFSITNFAHADNLTLNGDAIVFNKKLRVAGGRESGAGSVFYNRPIDPSKSFTSQFTFQVDLNGSGLVFIVQGDPRTANALGGRGGALGLGEIFSGPATPISPSIGVEFDTFFDQDFNEPVSEPNGNHIGIDINGGVETTPFVQPNPGFNLFSSGNKPSTVFASVIYTADNQLLKVFAGLGEATQKLQISQKLSGMNSLSMLGSQAYIGFSSSTGVGTENHFLLNWKFSGTFAPPAQTPLTGATSGQRLARGQLLATNLETEDLGSKPAASGANPGSQASTQARSAASPPEADRPVATEPSSSPLLMKSNVSKALDLGSAFTPDMLVS